MGDMGDYYREGKEAVKKAKENRLEHAQKEATIPWLKHTEHHWSYMLNGKKLDYWPSTGKWKYNKRIRRGKHEEIEAFINRKEAGEG